MTKLSYFFMMLLTLYITGCSYFESHKKPVDEVVDLDPTLLRPYVPEIESAEKFKAPFIAHYTYGEKNLTYVAALHEYGVGSPTHLTIERAFKEFEPQFLIVEGSAFTVVSDPDDIAYAKNCLKKNAKYCAEDVFAITEALKAKIPFSYGEPSDAGIHAALSKKGISDDELIAFYALKKIAEWNKLKSKDRLLEALARASKKFRAKKPMSEARFRKIFKTQMGRTFLYKAVNDETIRPLPQSTAQGFNKLANTIDLLQEHFLIKQIESRLNKYKKVLVVYGSSHLLKQRAMLNKVFGPSIDFSLFQK